MEANEAFKPVVAVTMGDPCGVGPEILAKALSSAEVHAHCSPVVIGDALALQRALDLLGSSLRLHPVRNPVDAAGIARTGDVPLIAPRPLSSNDIAYGQPTRDCCEAVIRFIEVAVDLALTGSVDAICTCPIHKANLHRHGFSFPGHTEFLKSLTRAEQVVMMLAGPRLRVALATIHHSLADVPGLLTPQVLLEVIRITGSALRSDFGLEAPRIAVAGLNPHAGEEGRFGTEEQTLIRPVVERFRSSPFSVSGPFPPDTLFYRGFEGEFDAIVAMYHDQGLIPIKLVHFHEAVNVSLGLPIVRTSVDHGTAYDLAGSGTAHPGSLIAALRLAGSMAVNRRSARSDSHPAP